MTTKHCPRCLSIYVYESMNQDIIHECTNEYATALRDEDVLVIAPWTDYTGTGSEPPQVGMFRGQDTRLWGTRPWREDAPVLPLFTVRGNSLNVYRTRQHLEYIDNRMKGKGK